MYYIKNMYIEYTIVTCVRLFKHVFKLYFVLDLAQKHQTTSIFINPHSVVPLNKISITVLPPSLLIHWSSVPLLIACENEIYRSYSCEMFCTHGLKPETLIAWQSSKDRCLSSTSETVTVLSPTLCLGLLSTRSQS